MTIDPELWHTTDSPQQMVDWLGGIEANIDRMTMFQAECRKAENRASGYGGELGAITSIRTWLQVSIPEACNILRCLFRNPLVEREKAACAKLGCYKGGNYSDVKEGRENKVPSCRQCKGTGKIDAPIIAPRWLSADVRDLVRVIRGGRCQTCKATGTVIVGVERSGRINLGRCGHCNGMCRFEAHHDLMPILGDALMDAGCDGEIIRHCMLGHETCDAAKFHVGGCWVLDKLTPGNSSPHNPPHEPARFPAPSPADSR